MDRLFRGMLFVLLDFQLNIGEHSIGLIPDWLGFIYLLQGFQLLEEEWDGFRKGQMPMQLMVVYSAVVYVLDALNLSIQMAVVTWALGLVSVIICLFITRQISVGICYMEQNRGWDLQGRKLQSLWLYLVVMQVIAVLFSWVPVVGIVCSVAQMIISIVWLVTLHGCRKRYWEETENHGIDADH